MPSLKNIVYNVIAIAAGSAFVATVAAHNGCFQRSGCLTEAEAYKPISRFATGPTLDDLIHSYGERLIDNVRPPN